MSHTIQSDSRPHAPVILIADDEPSVRQVIESVLGDQGYELQFASHGKECLKKAEELKPDLILLDIMMPEMDGIQVCQALRKNRDLANTPVVMLTALNDRDIRIASLDAGADDFFSKPFDRAELRARVRSITRLNKYRLLYERNQMFSWISEKSSDGYLLVQSNDQVVYANPRARFYLGMDLDSNAPIKSTFMEIIKQQYTPQPFDAWDGWPSTRNIQEMPIRYLVRPESNTTHEFWLEASIFEVPKDSSGTTIIRLRDVTADVLTRRNTRSFGEAIAHKLRTPIAHMVSSLDLLNKHVEKLSPKEIQDLSSTAFSGAKRLHETVNRILEYTSIYTNVDKPVGFDLSGLNALVLRTAEEKDITNIRLLLHDKLQHVKVMLPVSSMEVLLWEILGNSKKFHPVGTPSVEVRVFPGKDNTVIFQFVDDGIFLSPRQLTTAWVPYFQGEKDFTGEAPGMGLGLATVNTIVWSVGGTSQIANRKDAPGVVVQFNIPAVNKD